MLGRYKKKKKKNYGKLLLTVDKNEVIYNHVGQTSYP